MQPVDDVGPDAWFDEDGEQAANPVAASSTATSAPSRGADRLVGALGAPRLLTVVPLFDLHRYRRTWRC